MKVVLRMDELIKEQHCCKVTWMDGAHEALLQKGGGGGPIVLDQKFYLFIYLLKGYCYCCETGIFFSN
jgi:hypothetical protein